MEKLVCTSCHKPKAALTCSACEQPVCKTCAQFVDQQTFSFLEAMPGTLQPGTYCVECFETHVQPEVEIYDDLVKQAGNIAIYMKNQGKETRLLKRAQYPVNIENCEDRDEALLRLAFRTVQEGYDALVSVELLPKKIRNGTYQKAVWYATGTPAHLKPKKSGSAKV